MTAVDYQITVEQGILINVIGQLKVSKKLKQNKILFFFSTYNKYLISDW